MSLKEQVVRNHRLDGGLVINVAKEQDVNIVPGAQDTVTEVKLRQRETLEV